MVEQRLTKIMASLISSEDGYRLFSGAVHTRGLSIAYAILITDSSFNFSKSANFLHVENEVFVIHPPSPPSRIPKPPKKSKCFHEQDQFCSIIE